MVATISAREEIQSAQRYYTHLTEDDYYLQNEEIGFWYGRAAKFLDINQAVEPNHFKAALNGQHPSTKDQLVRLAKGPKQHKPGGISAYLPLNRCRSYGPWLQMVQNEI